MTSERVYTVRPDDMGRGWKVARAAFRDCLTMAQAGQTVEVRLGDVRRSLAQNSKLWPMLKDVSDQVNWYGSRLSAEEWKDVFTASLRQQRVVPGIDGGFVVLGLRTSKLKKKEFMDLIELMYAFGADRGVQWSEPALQVYETYWHKGETSE